MSFANWKKRSKLLQGFEARLGISKVDFHAVLAAAYKAGQQDGQRRIVHSLFRKTE